MASYAPVLVAAPALFPVTREAAKSHLRIEQDEETEDNLVDLLIAAASQRLDGYAGMLGQCMLTQTWRQDYDDWSTVLRLWTGPAQAISHVKYDRDDGVLTTLATSVYRLRRDIGGDHVALKAGQEWPDDLADDGLIQVTFTAGLAAEPDDVPAPLKQAILLLVGHLYANREEVTMAAGPAMQIPMGVSALIRPYLQPRFH